MTGRKKKIKRRESVEEVSSSSSSPEYSSSSQSRRRLRRLLDTTNVMSNPDPSSPSSGEEMTAADRNLLLLSPGTRELQRKMWARLDDSIEREFQRLIQRAASIPEPSTPVLSEDDIMGSPVLIPRLDMPPIVPRRTTTVRLSSGPSSHSSSSSEYRSGASSSFNSGFGEALLGGADADAPPPAMIRAATIGSPTLRGPGGTQVMSDAATPSPPRRTLRAAISAKMKLGGSSRRDHFPSPPAATPMYYGAAGSVSSSSQSSLSSSSSYSSVERDSRGRPKYVFGMKEYPISYPTTSSPKGVSSSSSQQSSSGPEWVSGSDEEMTQRATSPLRMPRGAFRESTIRLARLRPKREVQRPASQGRSLAKVVKRPLRERSSSANEIGSSSDELLRRSPPRKKPHPPPPPSPIFSEGELSDIERAFADEPSIAQHWLGKPLPASPTHAENTRRWRSRQLDMFNEYDRQQRAREKAARNNNNGGSHSSFMGGPYDPFKD